ncbi:MAG: hypothetical protein ACE5QF_07425 [Thermoplasmata archaeon]
MSRDRNFRWVHRLTGLSLAVLLASLLVPWWRVVVGPGAESPIGGFEPVGETYFLPLWSAFVDTELGTKLTLHFRNLLVILIGSLALTLLARSMLHRRPWLSPHLMWGSVAFSFIGLAFFSLFFPPVGSVGFVFWPWGSKDIDAWYFVGNYTWHVLPGFFLALTALLLQAHLAIRLSHPDVQEFLRSSVKAAPPRFFTEESIYHRLVFPVSFILGAASVWAGLSYYPAVSAKDFYPDLNYGYKSFVEGDAVAVTGTVTGSTLMLTSYGAYTLLALDGQEFIVALEGDQRASYLNGSWASVPIHFKDYSYNGFDYVWTDNGYAPLPMIYAVDIVMTAVSTSMGVPILANRTDPSGSTLNILLHHGLPLDEFNLSMYKVEGPFYMGESSTIGTNKHGGAIDQIDPLRPGTSDNGTMAFNDVNNNGLLDWGDTVELNLPPTDRETRFESYILRLYGPVNGIAFVVVGDRGPLLFYLHGRDKGGSHNFLTMPPDQVDGNRCSSRVEVLRKIGQDFDVADYTLRLFEEQSTQPHLIPAEAERSSLGGDSYGGFRDVGTIGALNVGDSWVFKNLTRGAFYRLELNDETTGTGTKIEWACGLGMNIARQPRLNLSALAPDPLNPQRYLIDVTSVDWVPAGAIHEYRAVLLKNDSPLLPSSGEPVRLVPRPGDPPDDSLPLGPSNDGAGTWIVFNDTDGNGYLGPGDRFAINNTVAQSTYELVIYYGSAEIPTANIGWTA